MTMHSRVVCVTVLFCALICLPGTEETSQAVSETKSTSEARYLRVEDKSVRQNDSNEDPYTEPSTKILFYSEWSSWTSCLNKCEKSRQRRCQNEKKCGNSVLKETVSCDNHQSKRTKRKCHRKKNRRKHRHKNHKFQVVQLNTNKKHHSPTSKTSPTNTTNTHIYETHHKHNQSTSSTSQQRLIRYPSSPSPVHWYRKEPSTNQKQRTSDSSSQHASSVIPPQEESPVIFQNTGGRIQSRDRHAHKYVSKLYGKWSRWSQCTRSCTTQRRRLCKRRAICGSDVIKEAAYCYVEGSYCQRWIQRKIQQNEEENEAAQDFYTDDLGEAASKSRGTYSHPYNHDRPPVSECGVAGNTSRSQGNMVRIIGGRPTSKGRWPWQVAVLNRFREAFCGGTLVSPRWVLTAAHCLRKRLYVRLGEHDLSEKEGTEIELRIDHVVQHPSYDAETVDNDVALLRLPLVVHPDRYRGLACLPKPRQALPTSQYCTIIGWGKRISSDTFGTDILHEAEVPIVSNDVCRHVYEDYHITKNMFCAGYRRGRMDSCAGDSGGPILCKEGDRWTIFGITSFGEGCGKRGKYGIYTRLSNYIKWIQKTIREEY